MTDPPRETGLKPALKAAARLAALVAVSPLLLSNWLAGRVLGRDRALESTSQVVSLFPGLSGAYLRRAFLSRTIAGCHPSAMVEFGTLFSQAGARVDAGVYIGPRCVLGLVHLQKDVLIASGVQIPSGGKTHAFADPHTPIRDQGGQRALVTVGEGAWVGAGAIVLADVGKGTIVAAGSVVTRPLPDFVIAAGVPAKVIRGRFDSAPPPPDPAHA